jgi:octaprenyl-diphosphate synthase
LDDESVERMAECGKEIGLAFQMIDDVLDIEGDPAKTGKRVGTDLLDGNPSLPIVWGLGLPEVQRAFETDPCTTDLADAALQALRKDKMSSRVRDSAVSHARRAHELLQELPDTPYRQALTGLVAELVDRDL